METKKSMYVVSIGALIFATVLATVSVGVDAVSKAKGREENLVELTMSIDDTNEVPQTESGAQPSTEPESVEVLPDISDLKLKIQVEAGTEEILPAMLFDEYTEQEVSIAETPTLEQLMEAGATYGMKVTYKEQEAYVEVEVIDTTAPTIDLISEIAVKEGESVSYRKYVKTSDNSTGAVKLDIDNSKVDLNTAGEYNVIYTATDASGNVATLETVLKVVGETVIGRSDVEEMLMKVIAEKVPEGTNEYDTAWILFNWVYDNIKYSYAASDRSSIWAGAYEGLSTRRGDCYVYYATYAALLTCANIDNKCVARVGGNSRHWWNLVNVGDGWYHCDSSPRRHGHNYVCFMQTDAQIDAYTQAYNEHPNYYTFDETDLPERETDIIFGDSPEEIITKITTAE